MPRKKKIQLPLETVIATAHNLAMAQHYDLITPEIFVFSLLDNWCQLDQDFYYEDVMSLLQYHISETMERLPEPTTEETIELSYQLGECLIRAQESQEKMGAKELTVTHVLCEILCTDECWANFFLREHLEDLYDFLENLNALCGNYAYNDEEIDRYQQFVEAREEMLGFAEELGKHFSEMAGNAGEEGGASAEGAKKKTEDWRQWVTCVNEHLENRNPLIGREDELERTIRVLCRRDKNNPLHVGDPGVGKTALIYGLAERIKAGDVPERLKDAQIFSLDVSTLLAGTQYRGDFEKRWKLIMEGLLTVPNAIVYIDEIHNIVGAGRTSDGAMDAANMLKPFLEEGRIRFVGATTHEEFNRHIAGHGALVRRFQTIEVPEPSIDEAVRILEGLQSRYESFHNVTFAPDAVRHAVHRAARFINDRRLPDKAIDLIDEAAAYREVHPAENQVVSKALIDQVLAGICKVESLRDVETSEVADLQSLEPAMKRQIFGQDEAIAAVTESVLLSRAGLTDERKPVASLLFVGPTGVGKTEVAKVLAEEMGVELLRFDMSEYAEKHTVARLIGAPAGYVGYEDGGLLTDAVRRTPHCVLLLDEIEKAHPDIFNLLLQVMDNASLTDTRGRQADFRHAVVVMTSNAGAQHAHQAAVGFGGGVSAGQAMLAQVKRTFKPEFLNRLSATVVFNAMSSEMAQLILRKKVDALRGKLLARRVELVLSPGAESHLLNLGYTPEYGAREIERIVARELKPLLTRSLLFGDLKHGGEAKVEVAADKLVLSTTPLALPAEAAESAPERADLATSKREKTPAKKSSRATTKKSTKKTTKKADE